MKLELKHFFIALLLLAGIFARFHQLEWHFSHIDDVGVAKTIVDSKREGKTDFFVIPNNWTYAPFQYFFTHWLLHPSQTYREILFWGRLPSATAGVVGLFLLLLFYQKFESDRKSEAVFGALALVALSWENIIVAKQMHNFALGVSACIGLMALWVYAVSREISNYREMICGGLLIAVLASMHYQIIFLIPAYYAALFLAAIFRGEYLKRLSPRLAAGAAACLAGVSMLYPLLKQNLLREKTLGLNYNAGPHYEFAFSLPSAGFFEKTVYTLQFFIKNFFLLFQSNMAFIPYSHPLFVPVTWLLLGLFFIGAICLARSKDRIKRDTAIFFAFAMIVWILLVVFKKTTFSPTRHSLIYLPLFAVVTSQGLTFFDNLIAKRVFQKIFCVLILLLFLSGFQKVVAERRDVLDEQDILKTLQKYHVDALLNVEWTIQVTQMRSIEEYFHYYDLGFIMSNILTDGKRPYNTIAWISHRMDLNQKFYREILKQVFFYNIAQKRNIPPLLYPPSAYEVVYSKVIHSDVEIEFSNATKGGTNNLFFYVLKRIGT